MKRFFSIILVITFIFSISGCDKKEKGTDKSKNDGKTSAQTYSVSSDESNSDSSSNNSSDISGSSKISDSSSKKPDDNSLIIYNASLGFFVAGNRFVHKKAGISFEMYPGWKLFYDDNMLALYNPNEKNDPNSCINIYTYEPKNGQTEADMWTFAMEDLTKKADASFPDDKEHQYIHFDLHGYMAICTPETNSKSKLQGCFILVKAKYPVLILIARTEQNKAQVDKCILDNFAPVK